MRATIDKAGRLVIPKQLRDHLGLRPGEVEVTAEGTGLRVEPLATESLDERGGRLLFPSAGVPIDDDLVRSLRDAASARARTSWSTPDAIALSVVDHADHASTFLAIGDRRLGLAGHAAFETFSVLTRLPPPVRCTPAAVARLLAQLSSQPIPQCRGCGWAARRTARRRGRRRRRRRLASGRRRGSIA